MHHDVAFLRGQVAQALYPGQFFAFLTQNRNALLGLRNRKGTRHHRTYVLGAIEAAKAAGALTIGFANNPGAPVTAQADIGITLDTGPEVISGSTRLKAGTSQKIALNTFSSALMVKLNKVYGNLMVDLKATNAKLVKRAVALTVRASGASEADAQAALAQCDHHVKTALVMLKRGVGAAEARALLDAVDGSVSRALAA